MTPAEIKLKLIDLYNEMYRLTNPKCGQCRVPFSCCSAEYCEMAQDYAKAVYDIDISYLRNKDSKIPFLHPCKRGDQELGCAVPPHLRPNCTLHHCSINSIGCFKEPGDTDKYFEIRNKIEDLEFKLTFEPETL